MKGKNTLKLSIALMIETKTLSRKRFIFGCFKSYKKQRFDRQDLETSLQFILNICVTLKIIMFGTTDFFKSLFTPCGSV